MFDRITSAPDITCLVSGCTVVTPRNIYTTATVCGTYLIVSSCLLKLMTGLSGWLGHEAMNIPFLSVEKQASVQYMDFMICAAVTFFTFVEGISEDMSIISLVMPLGFSDKRSK